MVITGMGPVCKIQTRGIPVDCPTREAKEAQNKTLARGPKVSALVLLTRQGIEVEEEVENEWTRTGSQQWSGRLTWPWE
jgi:hypothetical protein